MTQARIHKISWAAFARSLNHLRALTIQASTSDIEKFRRLASYEGKSPQQYLSSLMLEAIEIDEALNTPLFRRHGNRKSQTVAN